MLQVERFGTWNNTTRCNSTRKTVPQNLHEHDHVHQKLCKKGRLEGYIMIWQIAAHFFGTLYTPPRQYGKWPWHLKKAPRFFTNGSIFSLDILKSLH